MLLTFGVDKSINWLFPEGQDMYRRLIEAVHAGIYVADPQGKLLYVNHAFVNILGFNTKDEVIGLNLADRLSMDFVSCDCFLRQMKNKGFVTDCEIKSRRKDGSEVILSVTSNYIRNEKEEVIGIEGVFSDITEKKRLEHTMRMMANAVDQTADHVMITDKEGIIQYVNSAFEHTTGFTKTEVLGETPRILKSGRHPLQYYQTLWSTILSGQVFRSVTINKKKNGCFYYANQTITPIKDEKCELTHFVSVWEDISERIRLENLLKIEKEKFEEVIGFDEKISSIRKFERLFDFVVEKTCKILEAKKCSIMLLDHQNQELCLKASKGLGEGFLKMSAVKLGEPIAGWVAKEGRPLLVKDIEKDGCFQRPSKPVYESKSFMVAPIKLDERLTGVINVADKCSAENLKIFNEVDLKILLAIAREVAVAIENVKLYKELNYLTIVDPLTRIYNYRYLSRSLDYEIERANRFSMPLSLIMLDVDNFKDHNDTFGHLNGDQLLKNIGAILHEHLREIDVICRYAGDEFVVILPGTDIHGAKQAAEKMRVVIEKRLLENQVTVSIGVAPYARGRTRHDLILVADRALYQAKQTGKNQVCAFI